MMNMKSGAMTSNTTHVHTNSGSGTNVLVPDFRSTGLSIADWAREKGFNRELVYSVMRGERKCIRGTSFLIARELGMK